MSVLIKGMKMPTSCDGSCPLYDCEFLRCNITYTEPWLGHDGEPIEVPIPIPSDCPLIELPPHGRLIDADAMQMQWFNLNFDRKITDGTLAYWNFQLSKMPTIIEAEGGK